MSKKINYTTPEGVTLEILDSNAYRQDRQDSAFYTLGDGNTTIASVTYEDRELFVLCLGEMRFVYGDRTIYTADDLLSAGITSDSKLNKASDKGGEWVNNSWFEIYDSEVGDTDLQVYHSASEAIEQAIAQIQEREMANA